MRNFNRPRRIAVVSASHAVRIDLPDAANDPLGAVSLLAYGPGAPGWAMLLQAARVAAVTAAIAAVLSGRQLAYAGPFAAALGLAVVALRGETAEYLLLSAAGSGESPAKAIAAKLALESVGWLFVILVALAVSGIVTRWCFGRPHDTQHERTPAPRVIDGLYFTLIATAASLFTENEKSLAVLVPPLSFLTTFFTMSVAG
mgnify:CR=1 FL=1